MYRFRPRDFQLAVFKFRLVKGPLPTDGDLMRTITRGVRGTAMPPWHSLPIEDRWPRSSTSSTSWRWIAAIRAPYEYFVDQPRASRSTSAIRRRPRRRCWIAARRCGAKPCWEATAMGAGEPEGGRAQGRPQVPDPPADLTTGQFKSGRRWRTSSGP